MKHREDTRINPRKTSERHKEDTGTTIGRRRKTQRRCRKDTKDKCNTQEWRAQIDLIDCQSCQDEGFKFILSCQVRQHCLRPYLRLHLFFIVLLPKVILATSFSAPPFPMRHTSRVSQAQDHGTTTYDNRPLLNKTHYSAALALIEIFTTYGPSAILQCDNGCEFKNQACKPFKESRVTEEDADEIIRTMNI